MAGLESSAWHAAAQRLETQSVEVQSAVVSRAALRVRANIGWKADDAHMALVLVLFRLTLTQAICGRKQTKEMKQLMQAASAPAQRAISLLAQSTVNTSSDTFNTPDSASFHAARAAEL